MYQYLYRSIKDKKIMPQQKRRRGSWVRVTGASGADLESIARDHDLDPLILEDANDYYEVPRFEHVGEVFYFFTRYPINTADGEMSTAPLTIVFNQDYLFTFTHDPTALLDKLFDNPETFTTQRLKFFLIIMELVADSYDRSTAAIRKETQRYFGNFDTISEDDIEHFVGIESTITDYISALNPTRIALEKMLSSRHVTLHEEDADLVQDLLQDTVQQLDSARSLATTVRGIRDGYSAILANRLNNTIKLLTVLTIMMTVPTLVASVFGMNTWLPFGSGPEGFLYVIAIIVTLVGIFVAVLYKLLK